MRQSWFCVIYLCVLMGIALPAVTVAKPSSAARQPAVPLQGDWLVRGSVIRVSSLNENSRISGIGGRVVTPSSTLPSLDLSYFVTDTWAIEVQGGLAEKRYAIEASRIGNLPVARIEHGSFSIALQYHYRHWGRAKPYVGLGANYTWAHSIEPSPGIPAFEVDPLLSTLVGIGLDYSLANNLLFNLSARYLLTPAYDFQGQGFNATVKMDTLAVGTGIGYSF